MLKYSQPLLSSLPKLTITAVIDILVVAFFVYQFIMIVRGRRAGNILAGIGILLLVYAAAVWFELELLRSMLSTLAPYSAFALIVMFQSEIRRVLARIGHRKWFGVGSRLQHQESIDEILLAIRELAQQKTGGLIVLEREIGLRTFIESGVFMDAMVSRDLLLSIFQFGGALHDGAAIVQGDRIASAACFLPLSMNPALFRQLGTRHRAAIGITEETDCMSVIVSEETGWISIAAFGEIELNVTPERAEQRLLEHFGKRRRRGYRPERAPELSMDEEPREANRQ
jgi:diadenylate cyclase